MPEIMKMPFVFWQNIPNHLQSPWICSLAEKCDSPVWVVVEANIPEARLKLGWSLPDFHPATLSVGITKEKISRIIDEAGPDAVHVFTGLNAYRGVQLAFEECVRRGGLRLGLMSECAWRGGVAGGARFLLGMVNKLRFGQHLDFLLGLGEHAGRRFGHLGYPRSRLFDFAYYPPLPLAEEIPNQSVWPSGPVKLLHVGELSYRKGVDLVLRALGSLGRDDWFYGLVGCGAQEQAFKSLAAKVNIAEKVGFWGSMQNAEAMAVLRAADVLILASRMDGYGAVVNEALHRGVPVIISADSGACQVIRLDPALGSIVTSQSSLRNALGYWISQGPRTPEREVTIKKLSRCISPDSGADYFLQIMAHVYKGAFRPTPPWEPRHL